MRFIQVVLPLAVLAMPVAVMAGEAPCKNAQFCDAVLAAYPNAIKGCHGLKTKDNVIYAHYVAEVKQSSKDEVTVVFKDYDGKDMTKIKFAPGDATAKVDGQTVPFAKMREGTQLDFYIPQDKWGLYAYPGGPEMAIISREDL
jgi:hypothetical protein